MKKPGRPLQIAVLISGRGSNMHALVRQSGHYQICLVAANKPAAGLDIAGQHGITTCLVPRRDYDSKASHEAALADAIEASEAEWICLAGYMAVLSAEFIARFSGRIINIHPSLLPDYKGLDTHKRALADNQSSHGVSVHLVTPELDDGAVIAQMRLPVRLEDDEDSLSQRVLALEHILYPMVVNALASGALALEQDRVRWQDKSCGTDLVLPEEGELIFG
jgi:phosphoribosylglycinamide formyltransferase-1